MPCRIRQRGRDVKRLRLQLFRLAEGEIMGLETSNILVLSWQDRRILVATAKLGVFVFVFVFEFSSSSDPGPNISS